MLYHYPYIVQSTLTPDTRQKLRRMLEQGRRPLDQIIDSEKAATCTEDSMSSAAHLVPQYGGLMDGFPTN